MTNDKVRQDFEKTKGGKYSWDYTRDGDGYVDPRVELMWVGYQAGRAAERAEIVTKLESEQVVYIVATALFDTNPKYYSQSQSYDARRELVEAVATKILESTFGECR